MQHVFVLGSGTLRVNITKYFPSEAMQWDNTNTLIDNYNEIRSVT